MTVLGLLVLVASAAMILKAYLGLRARSRECSAGEELPPPGEIRVRPSPPRPAVPSPVRSSG